MNLFDEGFMNLFDEDIVLRNSLLPSLGLLL